MRFVGARLCQARVARGLTAKALAEAAEISPSAVCGYEQDKKVPSPVTLDKLARLLDVPARMFHKKMPENPLVQDVFYRSVSSATKALRDTLNQRATWMCEVFDYLEQHFSFSDINLPDLDLPGNFESISSEMIEEVAAITRKLWGLGSGPIQNLTDCMEKNGITVSKFSFDSDKMDGFSFWHRDQFPMVVIATDKESRSRSRFDLAHELGHLVLGHKRGDDPDPIKVKGQEDQANKFASAFLLPRESIVADLDELLATSSHRGMLNSLWPLKLKYKVSFAAILFRAKDVQKISTQQFQSGYVMLSQRGWRKTEPLEEELPEESPEILKWCVEKLVDDGDCLASELLESLALPQRDITEICGLPENYFETKLEMKRPIRIKKRE